jgi:hypothetical protein
MIGPCPHRGFKPTYKLWYKIGEEEGNNFTKWMNAADHARDLFNRSSFGMKRVNLFSALHPSYGSQRHHGNTEIVVEAFGTLYLICQ